MDLKRFKIEEVLRKQKMCIIGPNTKRWGEGVKSAKNAIISEFFFKVHVTSYTFISSNPHIHGHWEI